MSCGKFYSNPPASEMEPTDLVFTLQWVDVLNAAADSGPDGMATDLSSEEMHTFRKCLEAGLGSWSEVVQIALMAATVGRGEES